jgi:uncharacterized protein (DUF983 family)
MAQEGRSVSLPRALGRGLSMKCPACGEGRMFARFLKVADRCEVCHEELHHHQADDYPAYIVIFLIGKLVFAGVLFVELAYTPPYWVHFTLWMPLVLFGALGLLQPVKGLVVALQWHLGLHGFEDAKHLRIALAEQAVREQVSAG